MDELIQELQAYHRDFDPFRVAIKYRAMRRSAFDFFRGTCHLFYSEWAGGSVLDAAPPVWNCGDLHVRNFGTYRGDDGIIYFDINDFDEGLLAPCTWDLARLLTSIRLVADQLRLSEAQQLALCDLFIDTYKKTLVNGPARTVTRRTSRKLVKRLLTDVEDRKRKKFLKAHTDLDDKRRTLSHDEEVRPVDEAVRARVTAMVERWRKLQPEPGFYEPRDVAHYLDGLGSLGAERYIVLVEGSGSPDKNRLLDVQEARPSAVVPYVRHEQPRWANEAQRIVALHRRMQGVPPEVISWTFHEGKSYVVRSLQPYQEKIDLEDWNGKWRRLADLVRTMAQLVAWAQLRSGGRDGSAIPDELIDFANQTNWHLPLLTYSRRATQRVYTTYRQFCAAMNELDEQEAMGGSDVPPPEA